MYKQYVYEICEWVGHSHDIHLYKCWYYEYHACNLPAFVYVNAVMRHEMRYIIDINDRKNSLTESLVYSCYKSVISHSDVNECDLQQNNCHEFAGCNDTEGSYTCYCNDGFIGDGLDCTGTCS